VGRPVVEKVVAPSAVSLPVARGQQLGEVEVYVQGKLVARSPLVAARSSSRPGVLGRAGWYAKRTVDHVWGWIA
jgi:hypothetical protein